MMNMGGYGRKGANMIVMNTNTERDKGRKAQLGNIAAAKAVADIIRTTLGPRSMLKMILDPMGGIVMTNDGNAILREIDVNHPAAKSMIELSRTQDEEVGDGTTSVIILAGEILTLSEALLNRNLHPRNIVYGFNLALEDCISLLNPTKEQIEINKKNNLPNLHVDLDINNHKEILKIIKSTIGTKFMSRYGDTICQLALKAVLTCREVEEIIDNTENNDNNKDDKKQDDDDLTNTNVNIDIKRYARIERIPGGQIEDSRVLDGIILNKDVLHPGRMRRKINNPRIICLDCPLEYGKGESQTNIEITKGEDFEKYLEIEENYIKTICNKLISLKPDIVLTEKGCSELAQHFLSKSGISVFRRVKKLDMLRLARVSGGLIGHRIDLMNEKYVGSEVGLFEVRQISNETFSFFEKCKNPKACSVILRGGSKDVLQEMYRNLEDALAVTKNIILNPRIVPGGGATELALSTYLKNQSMKKDMNGTVADAYKAVAKALEVIPRILIQNCGNQPIKVLTELRKRHNDQKDNNRMTYGVNGESGEIISMNKLNIWEPVVVKLQTIKTAIESSSMLLRIDDVVSGIRNKEDRD